MNDLTKAMGQARLERTWRNGHPLTANGAYEMMTADDWPVMNSVWLLAQLNKFKHMKPHERAQTARMNNPYEPGPNQMAPL